ncbi:MAG TPA: hypothetical protein VM513_26170 [Kofleriaceae bacterium]|nr:hypothetical protein [Kofleriaceae bacterium]
MRALHAWPIALGITLVGACGASSPRPPAVEAPDEEPAPRAEPPAQPPPPPPPKQWLAKAALTPVKGAKLKPTLVSFAQREGQETTVEADSFDGAKPGTYWLIIHAGDSCGPNATKAGAAWELGAPLKIVIAKDLSGGLETGVAPFDLDGDDGATGRTLVLHEDKKGKPGKAVACGAIEAVDEP